MQSDPEAAPPLEEASPFSLDESASPSERLPWEVIFGSIPQAIVILDEHQGISYTNPAHHDLLGIDAAQCADGMEEWFRAVCPDPEACAEIVSSWHEQIWRNQLTRTYVLKSTSHGPRHIEFRSTLSSNGHMILIQNDVTDQLASDEALRQASLKFRTVFANAAGGIVLVSQDGAVQEVNHAFIEFSGLTASQLVGTSFSDLLHPEDAAELAAGESEDATLASEAPQKLRFVFEGQEREKSALVTCSHINDRENEATLRIYQLKPRDTQLLAKLRDLSLKAQSLLDAIPNMFVLLDNSGNIIDWSPPTTQWDVSVGLSAASKGEAAQDHWQAFGKLLDANLEGVFGEGLTVRCDVPSDDESATFPVTLAPFGKDLALALIEEPSGRDLSGSDHWLARFFDSAREAVLVASGDGEIVDANPAASSLTGKDREGLLRSNLFQLLSRSPGSDTGFDASEIRKLNAERQWTDLLSVSPSGPLPVDVMLLPVPDEKGENERFVAMIQPHQVESLSPTDVMDLAQQQFRSQLQTVSSLFSIAQSNYDPATMQSWLIRLKVLSESITTSKRVGIVHLLRNIADQVASVAGRGLGPREVMVTGSSSLTVEDENVTPFAMLAGEIICLAVCGSAGGTGPAIYMEVDSVDGNIELNVKPGENRELFTSEKMEDTKVIEILVEQIREN